MDRVSEDTVRRAPVPEGHHIQHPPTLVFCHANGFPAGTYGVLFEAWRRSGWRVLAPEKFGHDPRYGVSNGWRALRDELLTFVERDQQESGSAGPVALVGHSMGGYLALLAASRKPALASAVVLLDAPIVSGWRVPAFGLAKATGLIQRGGPGVASARRREHWPTLAAVREHFAGKAAFARWDPRVFDDYLRHGFHAPEAAAFEGGDDVGGGGGERDAAAHGVRLAFARDTETRIYTLPHHVPALLCRHRCAALSRSSPARARRRTASSARIRPAAGRPALAVDEGSHLFPMEKPEATAAAVLALLESTTSGPGAPDRALAAPSQARSI
ncbi:MAG: alpha/beta hydrolase [Rubrivivax sp.]